MIVIETPRLLIRRVAETDLELFLALWTDPQVMHYVGFPQGLPISRDAVHTQLVEQQGDTIWEWLLVVVLKETGQAIGECKMRWPDEAGISTTDVKLLPDHWGQRYGVEIKRALVDYLFTYTDCAAVEADPNVNNIASIKMQEAVGGVRVGERVHEFPAEMRSYTSTVHAYIYRVYRGPEMPTHPGV